MSNTALPPSRGPPQLHLYLLLTIGVATAGPIKTTRHPALVLLALWNILPMFSLSGTRGGLGLPRMCPGARKHTSPQELHCFSYSFEEH